jgi:peroxiredoxin
MLRFLLFLVLTTAPVIAFGGEYNPKLNYDDPAPAWADLPGVDGKRHALGDLKDKDVVVVAFTCNSCPYAVDYEDRMIAFAKKHAGPEGKVALVAINVNLVAEDSLEKMTERAKERGFPFAYLFDESQTIAREFGATRTPEFFVLNRDRRVVYMGAFDDNTDAAKVTKNYVDAAVAAAQSGDKPATVETVPIGCLVRYKRERKGK